MREVEFGRRAWSAEQVALPVGTAGGAHKHKSVFGLDSLGDRVDAEASSQAGDRGHDRPAVSFLRYFGHERTVDLDLVKPQFAQVPQARISSAEIIHYDGDAGT